MSEQGGRPARGFWGETAGDGVLEQYRTLVNTIDDGIYQLDADGRFVAVNDVIVDRLGYSRDDLIGAHVSTVLDDSDVERIGRAIRELLETPGDDVATMEVPVETATGEAVYFELRVNLLESDGEFTGTIGVAREITDRRERERQLRRERNQTETLLETTPVAVAVSDSDGETIRANQRAQAFLGRSEANLIEGTQDDAAWTTYDADGTELDADELPTARVLDTGEPVYETEIAIADASGERTWFRLNAEPVFDEDGDLERVITTGEDITALKTRERQLEQRKNELETELGEILGRVSDGFFAVNEDWEFTHINAQADDLLNPEGEDLEGENLWEQFPEATERTFEAYYRRAMREQVTVSFEEYYPEPLDTWFEVRAYPSETGLSVYFRDISDRKDRERELEQYETIVETIDDGIYVKDADGRFAMVNDAYVELTGYSREELIGEHASLVVDEDAIARSRDRLDSPDETNPTMEAAIETADGDSVPAEGTFATLEMDGVELEVGVVRDITERKAYERRIEESERRYRTLVEHFPDGAVGLFDEDLAYTAVGGELLERLDLDPEDGIGRTLDDIHDDELVTELEPHFRAALDGDTSTFEVEYRDRYLRATTLPVGDVGNEVRGMLMVQDVTERREMEQDLRESEARFRMLAENLEEVTWMAGPKGDEILYVNPAYEDVWGRDRAELYDESLSFLEYVHPDDRERVRDAFTALPDEMFDEEYRIIRPDGEIRWMQSRGRLVYDSDTELERIVGIGQDVTERREREYELERALDLLERTERVADVGGWEIDTETMDVFWTDHIFEVLQVDADEEPPLDEALDMYHEDDQPVVEEAVETALATGEPFDIEARIHTTGGDIRWLRLQGVPEVEDGEVVSLRGAAQNITDRKEREAELEASNERLEQFAYAASHDLQEPLRMVSSYLSLIERRYEDVLDEEGEEFLDYAIDGAERMREMIDALLKYSRVDTRGDPFEPVDLDAVLESVLSDYQVRIRETDADVTTTDLPTVLGDGDQLRQVFGNLINNALEYSGDEPPTVRVFAERDGDRWIVGVEDDGIGIEPEHEDRVFDVFQRLHTQEEHGGTGIGLALAQRIVERHEGDIWVESTPGEGSTFYCSLPVVEATDD